LSFFFHLPKEHETMTERASFLIGGIVIVKKKSKWSVGNSGLVFLVALAVFSFGRPAFSSTAHSDLKWSNAQMCLQCHTDKASEVVGSAHYTWEGATPYMVNGPKLQGKLKTAVNSYCGNIIGNWGCASCHVGLGKRPDDTSLTAQQHLQNIDCLVCHQKDYLRKKDPVTGLMVPDTTNMLITMDKAVQTLHEPTRAACLTCHAKGGGGDNNKRGDLSVAHGTTSDRKFDVHMAKTGANLNCQECHTTDHHRIAGRGADLRQTDLDVKMNCSTSACHSGFASGKHPSWETLGKKHFARVACQTCHISTFARNAADTLADESTEIERDWSEPEWSAALKRWEPKIVRGSNLKPVYKFWNGTSWGYSLAETAALDPETGRFPTARPVGDINSVGSKLFPFKYKTTVRPHSKRLGVLIPIDTKVYFAGAGATPTGVDASVKSSLKLMGHSETEPYEWGEDDTYQLITHEVMDSDKALKCENCHGPTATQMNLKKLGYVLKASAKEVCTQCHGYESPTELNYRDMHNKHVTDKKIKCATCHPFNREAS